MMKKNEFVSLNAIFIAVTYTVTSYGVPQTMLTDWLVYITWWCSIMGVAFKNLSMKSIFPRHLQADLDLILSGRSFVQIWIWTYLTRLDSSDWWDVWFWMCPLSYMCALCLCVVQVWEGRSDVRALYTGGVTDAAFRHWHQWAEVTRSSSNQWRSPTTRWWPCSL